MRNLVWYICLAFISLVCVIYAIYKKRSVYKVSTLVVFYLFSAGLSWIGEFIVLGIFNAYAYKTGLFADPWEQNLLGHLLINTTLYPAAAVIMAAYSLRYGWIFLNAALFTFLEYIFIKFGIYEQHWWRYYMTTIIVVAILLIDNKSFQKIKHGCQGLTRAIIFYFVALIVVHIPAPILLLLGKQYYKISFVSNLFHDVYLSSIVVIFSYHLVESFLLVLFTCILNKWYWRIVPFIISITIQSIFVHMGILIFEDWWNLIYTLLTYEIFIAIFILIEKYTVKPDWNYLN